MSKPTFITNSKKFPEMWGAVFNKTSPSCPRDYVITVNRIIKDKDGKSVKVPSFRLNQLDEALRIYEELIAKIEQTDPAAIPDDLKKRFDYD